MPTSKPSFSPPRATFEESLEGVSGRNGHDQRVDDLRQLHVASDRLAGMQTLSAMLHEVLEAALLVQGSRQGLLSLVDPTRNGLVPGASAGFSPEQLRGLEFIPAGNGGCGMAYAERRRVLIEDTESDPTFRDFREFARQAGFRALHSTPLITQEGTIIGTLSVHFPQPYRPTEREMQLTDLYARQAADRIESMQLRERLECELAERKQAEAALRASEERLRLATAIGKVGVWEWDVPANRITWTDSLYVIHGVTRETFTPTMEGFKQLVHPDDLARVSEAIRVSLEQHQPYEVEFRAKKTDGAIVWLFTSATVIREHGRPVRMIGSTVDITARHQANDAGRRLAAIVETSEDAIFSKDLNSILTSWNSSAQRLFGYTSAEMIGRPVTILMPAERLNEEPTILRRLRRGEPVEPYETVRQRKDGSLIDVLITVSPLRNAAGAVVGASSIVRDITSRKRIEAALRASEERFRMLTSHAPVGIFLSDPFGGCLFVNQTWCKMSGLTPDHAQGEGWANALHPDDRKRVLRDWHAAVQRGDTSESEFRFRRPDGTIVWLHGSAVQFRHGGRFTGYLGSCIDITERKLAELNAVFLQELSRRIMVMSEPHEIILAAQAALGNHLQADRCFFLEFDDDHSTARIESDWHAPNLSSMAGEHRLADYGTTELANLFVRSRMQLEVMHHPATRMAAAKYQSLGIRTIASAAYWHDNQWRATLAVTTHQARTWRDDELALLDDVLARVWPLVEQARVRRVLAQSEARWRQLAEAMPHLVWSCRPDGLCDFLSPQWLAYTGGAESDQLGEGWIEFIHPEDRDVLIAQWQESIRTGAVLDTEFRIRRVDGVYRWFKTRAVPIRDQDGRIVKWYGSNTDIEEFRRAAQAVRTSEQQLRLVTDHAPIYLAQCDREHRFKFVNRTYAERYSLQRDEIIGRHVADLVGAEAYRTFQLHMDTCLTGQRVEFEQEIPYATLGRRWMHVIYEPERATSGEITGLVAVIVDITARKRAEQELERARDEALAASRAKDDFLAALSHELRTPLSPVLLLASDAANNPALPRDIRAIFDVIRGNVSLEARLIDDLLDLTRITRGKISIEKQLIDVHDVLRDAIANIRAEIEEKRLTLSLTLGAECPRVMGDPVRLQQVLWNIIKNAVKFTPDDGQIAVSTRLIPQRDLIEIEVADSGIGMTPVEIARAFEAFSQGDHATNHGPHRFGGLGLGLAISQKLVEMHAGRIEASSEGRNRGSTLRVQLPLAKELVHADPPTALSVSPFEKASLSAPLAMKILLVEDHAATRLTLEKLLVRRKFSVAPAGSATEALQLARSQTFDVVVSDVGLPDGDGYQLMVELRAIQPHIAGIALSGYGMEDDLHRSQNAGFAAHLVKPVSIGALERALASLTPPEIPMP